MSESNYQKVSSANSSLQAVAMQVTLENAGIPVEVSPSPNDSYLDVMVPEGFAGEAVRLIYPECPRGEICCAAARDIC
ncbi:MAG TPA: hypothetical protein VHO48_08700 [Anaerolineaceae bacterium]|nr:hypothetical protein [Anaerolineaceae bacterium]